MSMLKKVYLPLILFVTCFAAANSYAGLLVNGGFEKGNFSGWRMCGNLKIVKENAHAGSYCLKGEIGRGINTGGELYQWLKVRDAGTAVQNNLA